MTTEKQSTKTGKHLTNLEPSTTESTPFTKSTPTLSNVSGGVISNKIDLHTTGNLNFYTTGNLNFYTTSSSSGSGSSNYKVLFSSQEPNFSTTHMELLSSTTALRSVLPLNFSNSNPKILKVISVVPSKVHYTISDSLTTFKANASASPDSKDLSTSPTVDVKLENTKKDNPNSTIALGITISLFALAVIIVALMIIRVLYKSRKNVDLKSDDISTVFCSDDFMHSTGFINDVPSSVATHDFIKIRKVSDSTTDEMMEVEDQRFNNKTYGESTFGGGSTPKHSPNRVNQDSKYAGLSGFKKYPAPQPSKASSYVSNRNSRYNSQQSDTDYFQYKRH
ncbi:unnamed protein product [Mytilus coruscus]|uniref:Uncharacterized protein n=1 Tax=Mytilus coruscus TaxID=42192 RepID=A0A6J8DX39_MYTCO|nr:unnamed protein product [Mytilus coruscus]